MIFKLVTYYAVRKFGDRSDQTVSQNLEDVKAIENAQRGHYTK